MGSLAHLAHPGPTPVQPPASVALNYQAKHWCFTAFPPIDRPDLLPVWNEDCMDYLTWGTEICPTTGRTHYQGFVSMKTKRRRGGVVTALAFPGIHVEPMRGSMEAAIRYCHKDGNVTEFGTRSAATGVPDVSNLIQLARTDPLAVLKYGSKLDYLKVLLDQDDCDIYRSVLWLWGPSGCGKTRMAWKMGRALGATTAVTLSGGGTPFMLGYRDHEVVILDDIRPGDVPVNYLLRLLDRYPMVVNVKGSERVWKTKYIIMTNILPPQEFFGAYHGEELQQLLRRITEEIYVPEFLERQPNYFE